MRITASRMKVHNISQTRTFDPECHATEDADIPISTPFHDETSPSFLRRKFTEAQKSLKPNESIDSVVSKKFRECYYIKTGDSVFRYDTTYDGKDIFKPFTLVTTPQTADATDLLVRLNVPQPPECRYTYSPASTALKYLDDIVKECAEHADLMITNVVDHPAPHYFVTYHFFSTTYHKVKFIYGAKGEISAAMPSSSGVTDDPAFQLFLKYLDESR